MSGLKAKAQFACAWIYDDRQILCYLWDVPGDEGEYVVRHLTQDPDMRLCFELNFVNDDETTGEFKAWDYFESIRTSAPGIREKIENAFDGFFEECGKEYADA